MFLVRKAKVADMPMIDEMAAILFPNSPSRRLAGDSYLIAERGGVPVGFCHFRVREKSCYIAGLGVLSHYRNHGVGGQLLSEALFAADKKGVQTTYLKVRALNHAAKLYHDLGFFERRWGDTLVLVRKRPS